MALKPGETITAEALAADCGLAREMVEQLLAATITSELFERSADGRVARRGIVETTTFSDFDRQAIIVNGRDAEVPAVASKPPKS